MMQEREFHCYDRRNQTYSSCNLAELAQKIQSSETRGDIFLWSPQRAQWIGIEHTDELRGLFDQLAEADKHRKAPAETVAEMEATAATVVERGPTGPATREQLSLESWLASIERYLFLAACLLACSIFWLSPRPPMIDAPQHAGQITLLRDLIFHRSLFTDLVTTNFITPYLIGYLLAVPFSIFLPAATALQIVSTIALISFIVAGVFLRKEISDDRRFDWLFLLGFFGFVFQYGVFVFYMTAPLFLYAAKVQIEHARTASTRSTVKLILAGSGLLFSHGLFYALSFITGPMVTLYIVGLNWRVLFRRALPYILLLVEGAIVYFVMRVTSSSGNGVGTRYDESFLFRLYSAIVYVGGVTFGDSTMFYIIVTIFVSAFLVNARLYFGFGSVLLASVIATLLLAPDTVSGIFFIRPRFAMLLGPFCALTLAAPRGVLQAARFPWLSALARATMIAATFAFLGLHAARAHAVVDETRDFEDVLRAAAPGKHAFNIVFADARLSPAAVNGVFYVNWALWYQADKAGFVEFNFATFPPQVVRFRPGAECSFCAFIQLNPEKMDWKQMSMKPFDYVFIRGGEDEARQFFNGSPCEVRVAAQSGMWWLFALSACP
jgi:hypothetical protein